MGGRGATGAGGRGGEGEEERRKEKEEKEKEEPINRGGSLMQIRRIGKYNQFSDFVSHKMANGPVVAIDDMIHSCKQNQPVTN
jgi:hypothetical protein